MNTNRKTIRRRLMLAAYLVILGVLLALSACGSQPASIKVHGTLQTAVSIMDGQNAADAFPDISDGSQVTVVNSAGTVIGTGQLSQVPGQTASMFASSDSYSFAVTVPGGLPRYGIMVGHDRGTVYYSAAQMASGPALCLGDGC